MSPKAFAPSIASVRAGQAQSASEWPARPSVSEMSVPNSTAKAPSPKGGVIDKSDSSISSGRWV